MRGYSASAVPTVYASVAPAGDPVIVSVGVLAPCPVPIIVSVPVLTGNILRITTEACAYAHLGVCTPQARIYVGGVGVGGQWNRNLPHAGDADMIKLTYVYTVLADNPALSVEVWYLRITRDWKMLSAYTSGLQVVKW